MGGTVGEVVEVGGAEAMVFDVPDVGEALAGEVADWPIVMALSAGGVGDGVYPRLALPVALDAGVVGADGVEVVGVDDIKLGRPGDVFAAGAVAFFAADVPLGDFAVGEILVDGVAAVAERAGGALHVVGGVLGCPPVGSGVGDVEGEPLLVGDVPLGGEDVVVVADEGEEALLVTAAVDEGDLIEGEVDEGVGGGEVCEDGFRVEFGIADDVGHASLLPGRVGGGVAGLALSGADEVGLGLGGFLGESGGGRQGEAREG